ncbi:MAG TPA: sugar phosphate isomerase/epimerase [bacterium]|nr:sugar phosphate isomerase/epimerase [bacterium]HPQ65618.1 sugar phosphate isomerase/epimerase [bacterium]
MNSPFFPLDEEFRFAAGAGFDFLELTIEPPATPIEELDAGTILELSREHSLPVPVGHNSWYIPYANPLTSVREACLPYLEACFDLCRDVGIDRINVHTNLSYSSKLLKEVIRAHVEFLTLAAAAAGARDIRLMLEPVGSRYDTFETISLILDSVENLHLHLDLGHANITEPDGGAALIARYGPRLLHVHVSDNRGDDDQHLPLGCGSLELDRILGALREAGYDGTFTLEIFASDRDYLLMSRDIFLAAWEKTED